MNHFKYGLAYSSFHGCTQYRISHGMIVLDFQDAAFDPWEVLRLYESDSVHNFNFPPLVRAFQIHFKTEAQCTVFCKDDSWTLLLGKERTVIPMPDRKTATIHLYATQYYVYSPGIVDEYMQGLTRSAHENFYPYKNCILYLDNLDIPEPGACYMQSVEPKNPAYRICLLTTESDDDAIASIASEWKNRRNVYEIPFLTRDATISPKFINFEPIRDVELPEVAQSSHGVIHKRSSTIRRTHCLIQDVLHFYRQSRGKAIKDLGVILEWPLIIAYDGSHRRTAANPISSKNDKRVVALAVNGRLPKSVIRVNYPYENFVEFSYVPNLPIWTHVSFEENVLVLPSDLSKVSIDSTVVGFVYRESFFCFNDPLLEGISSWESNYNVSSILNPASSKMLENDPRIRIVESFRLDETFSLHRVQFRQVSHTAWCLSESRDSDAYPKQLRLSPLVREWTSFMKRHQKINVPMIDPHTLKLAIALTRHDICYFMSIDDRERKPKDDPKGKPKKTLILTDDGIVLYLTEDEVNFVNSTRLLNYEEESEEEKSSCAVM